MDSIDVLIQLCAKNAKINAINYFRFAAKTNVQGRLVETDANESQGIAEALRIKDSTQLSFWASLFWHCSSSGSVYPRLFKEVLFHNSIGGGLIQLRDFDERTVRKLSAAEDVALNSTVVLESNVMHIPMLDFKIPSSSELSADVAEEVVRSLGFDGYLLDSGKSYHFIGTQLLTESELVNLLAKFSLYQPIADAAWAAHQILERSASLRISAKHGKMPQVVRMIGITG